MYFRLSPNVYKMAKLFITKDTVILRKLAKLGKEIVSVFGHVSFVDGYFIYVFLLFIIMIMCIKNTQLCWFVCIISLLLQEGV